MKHLTLLFIFLFCSIYAHAQSDFGIMDNENTKDQPFTTIERAPKYPGCRGKNNQKLKDCMSKKVSKLVNKNFNARVIESTELGDGTYKIYVMFRINNTGEIDKVRIRAPHPVLEKETRRVINLIPKMKPGQVRGRDVGVLYSLPITFRYEDRLKNTKKAVKKNQ